MAARLVRALAVRPLRVGDRAPDFAVPEARGRSSAYTTCLLGAPSCSRSTAASGHRTAAAVAGLERVLPELATRQASLVAVSPMLPDGSLSAAETNWRSSSTGRAEATVARDYVLSAWRATAALRRPRHAPPPAGAQRFDELLGAAGHGSRDRPAGSVRHTFSEPELPRRLEPAAILDRARRPRRTRRVARCRLDFTDLSEDRRRRGADETRPVARATATRRSRADARSPRWRYHWPPRATVIAWPLMPLPSSLARKAIMAATSSGRTTRPSGYSAARSAQT